MVNFEPTKPLVHISSKVPSEVRDKARALAKEKGVTESLIYRSIIVDFFLDKSPQNVDENATICGEQKQPA